MGILRVSFIASVFALLSASFSYALCLGLFGTDICLFDSGGIVYLQPTATSASAKTVPAMQGSVGMEMSCYGSKPRMFERSIDICTNNCPPEMSCDDGVCECVAQVPTNTTAPQLPCSFALGTFGANTCSGACSNPAQKCTYFAATSIGGEYSPERCACAYPMKPCSTQRPIGAQEFCKDDCRSELGLQYACDTTNCTCFKRQQTMPCSNGTSGGNQGFKSGYDACLNDCNRIGYNYCNETTCKCQNVTFPTSVTCSNGTKGGNIGFKPGYDRCYDDCNSSYGPNYSCNAISCKCEKMAPANYSCSNRSLDKSKFKPGFDSCSNDCDPNYFTCSAQNCTCQMKSNVDSCAMVTYGYINATPGYVCYDDCDMFFAPTFSCNPSTCKCENTTNAAASSSAAPAVVSISAQPAAVGQYALIEFKVSNPSSSQILIAGSLPFRLGIQSGSVAYPKLNPGASATVSTTAYCKYASTTAISAGGKTAYLKCA